MYIFIIILLLGAAVGLHAYNKPKTDTESLAKLPTLFLYIAGLSQIGSIMITGGWPNLIAGIGLLFSLACGVWLLYKQKHMLFGGILIVTWLMLVGIGSIVFYNVNRPEARLDDWTSMQWFLVIPFFMLHMLVILFGIGFFTVGMLKNKNTVNNAILACPHCEHKQEIDIPQTGCLAFHKCEKCGKEISVPKESKNCCVVCEYSDKMCPIGHKDE